MTNKMKAFSQNFIRYFFYLAVFAQVVSGTVYLVCNFADFIVYPETEEMVNAARNLIFDEYIGFLYPLFIRLCLGIQKSLGIGYYIVAHFIQLLLFVGAIFYMIKPFFSGKKAWVGSFLVTSFPFCMQSILMVSPFAFKAAFSFFMVGAMVRIYRQKEKICMKSAVVLGISYLLASFNQPDDKYLWILPIFVLTILLLLRRKEVLKAWKKLVVLLVAISLFFVSFFICHKVIDEGARGRMQKTVYSVLFQRTIWPDLRVKYGFLPEEMWTYISSDDAVSSNQYAEYIVYSIGPKIENQVGVEKANELYKEAVLNQLSYNKRAIFENVSEDFLGYLFEPYTTIWHMNGQGGSAFGKLYSSMSEGNAKGAYGYMCVSFMTLFVLTLGGILSVIKKKLLAGKERKRLILLAGGMLIYQALFYAVVNVQGVDYRYVLLNMSIYLLFALWCSLFYQENKPVSDNRKLSKKAKGILGAVFGGGILLAGVIMTLQKGYKESDMLENKKIVCFGDSIWGLVDDETGIAKWLEKMTGATVYNYAIPGTTAVSTLGTEAEDDFSGYSLYEIVSALASGENRTNGRKMQEILAAPLQEADYLILEYGLNDYFKGAMIQSGDKYEVTCYAGAFRYAIETLQEKYPNLQIVLLGQTYCQFYSYGLVEEDSDTCNLGGGVGTDYVKALSEVAKEYDLLFINLYEELPINEWNGTLFLEDATHLNERGRKEYAQVVAKYLLEDFQERNAQ